MPTPSVARQWNEAVLQAIQLDVGRPTVAARNLFHASVAMYDAWAAYDPLAEGYIAQEEAAASDVEAAREQAISFAAYRVLSARFAPTPNAPQIQAVFDGLMDQLGYDRTDTTLDGNSPVAVGNRIGAAVIAYGLADGSNEANNYADTTGYMPVNPPLDINATTINTVDPNRWQPLIINAQTQRFLTPQWGDVAPFALPGTSLADDPYFEPSPPPQLGGPGDVLYKAQAQRLIRYSSWLDPSDGALVDVSPAVHGNNTLGLTDGLGYWVNPVTGQRYAPNVVRRGDWARVVTEYWVDGQGTVTPAGHWNVLANQASDRLQGNKRIAGAGSPVSDLEWDVKLYFTLNGALHDAAIASWDVKRFYDSARPATIVRYTGSKGQSSDPFGPSYDPQGLPLVPGLIEVITAETTAAGGPHVNLAGNEGQIAIFAWRGPPAGVGPSGVGWILATAWMPYQERAFVTPGFPGYTSGHSTFSRSAAEVLTLFTGDPFFPGGLMEFTASAGDYLRFDEGPSESVTLQWATYYDAADEAGLSRIIGGIHVTADDYAGRIIGSQVGRGAWYLAEQYFAGAAVPPVSPVRLVSAVK